MKVDVSQKDALLNGWQYKRKTKTKNIKKKLFGPRFWTALIKHQNIPIQLLYVGTKTPPSPSIKMISQQKNILVILIFYQDLQVLFYLFSCYK